MITTTYNDNGEIGVAYMPETDTDWNALRTMITGETAPDTDQPAPTKSVEKLEVMEAETAQRTRYVEALYLGLNREPDAYEYKGEMVDCGPNGKCVCGHAIRNGFVLHHKERKSEVKIVGCVCVEYFATINAELYASLMTALADFKRKITQAKAASKRAAAEAEVEALRQEWQALYDRLYDAYASYRNQGLRAPRVLWEAFGSWRYGVKSAAPEYTRPSDFKRWYKAQIAALQAIDKAR